MKFPMSILLFAGFLAVSSAHATEPLLIRGTLESFDEEKIVLKQEGDVRVVVPRGSIPSLKGYTSGVAEVVAFVAPSDFVRMNAAHVSVSKKK